VHKLESRFENLQVGPLITMPRENLSNDLAQGYIQLTYWYSKIFDKGILGLKEVWASFAGVVAMLTDGDPQSHVYCTVALPESKNVRSNLKPTRFVSSKSCLTKTTGFDLKATWDLVRMLTAVLSRDFGIRCSPGINLQREPSTAEHAKDTLSKVILVGASNMRPMAANLSGRGPVVETMSLEGGIPTEHAIKKLRDSLKGVEGVGRHCNSFRSVRQLQF